MKSYPAVAREGKRILQEMCDAVNARNAYDQWYPDAQRRAIDRIARELA